MRVLRPVVHHFLVHLSAFEDEDVDDLGVGDVAVAFELFADDASDVRGGAGEREAFDDFGGLCDVNGVQIAGQEEDERMGWDVRNDTSLGKAVGPADERLAGCPMFGSSAPGEMGWSSLSQRPKVSFALRKRCRGRLQRLKWRVEG